MSRRSRAPLPPGEEERLLTLDEKVLALLEEAPRTNTYLSWMVAKDYSRCVRAIREKGRVVHCTRVKENKAGGLTLYTLMPVGFRDPEWDVEIKLSSADGYVSIQKIVVEAESEGVAKNRAQHLAAKTKILSVKRKWKEE
jgi:hypothetical protein